MIKLWVRKGSELPSHLFLQLWETAQRSLHSPIHRKAFTAAMDLGSSAGAVTADIT